MNTNGKSIAISSVPRPSMPLTGALLAVYLVAVVLFSQFSSTVIIATFLAFILTAVFAIEMLGRTQQFVFPMPLVWFLLFLCYSTLQMIWLPGSITMLSTLYQLLILATIIVNYGMTAGDAAKFDWAVHLAVACTFIYNLVAHPEVRAGRIGSTLVNANSYSFFLIIGLILALRRMLISSLQFRMNIKNFTMFVFYIALILYGLFYLAGSRKGIVIAIGVMGIITLYWLWQQPYQRRIWYILLVFALFAGIIYALYESPQFSRVIDLSTLLSTGQTDDSSLLTREHMLQDGYTLWLQRPIFGFGLAQYSNISSWGTYSHNNYIELLVGGGIISLLSYIMIYAWTFVILVLSFLRCGNRVVRAEAFWALVTLVALVGWDLASVNYYDKLSWLLLSVVITVAARAKQAGSRVERPA